MFNIKYYKEYVFDKDENGDYKINFIGMILYFIFLIIFTFIIFTFFDNGYRILVFIIIVYLIENKLF